MVTAARAAPAAYDHGQRFLLCDRCGASVGVPNEAGRTGCQHCGSPLEVRMRLEAALAADAPASEAERVAALRAQDVRFVPPPAVAHLWSGNAVAPAREAEALARWQHLRGELRSAAQHDLAEQLFFLTVGLAAPLFARGELLRQRALVESALEVLSGSRHQQMLRCLLARSAARAGDHPAAETWLGTCDPRSVDLHADTAYRFARAYLDTFRHEPSRVLQRLGTGGDVPLSEAHRSECTVLSANAWEQLGQTAVAVEILTGLLIGFDPLARRRADRFLREHAAFGWCRRSAPEAAQRAAALSPAPPYEGGTAASVLLGLAIYGVAWTALSVVALPVLAALGAYGGLMGVLASAFGGVTLALLFTPLALHARRKLARRRRLLASGLVHPATVLSAGARPDPMFGTEGVVEITADLLVLPDDGPPYRTRTTVATMQETAAFFGPNASVVLRVDPHDPGQQLLDVG